MCWQLFEPEPLYVLEPIVYFHSAATRSGEASRNNVDDIFILRMMVVMDQVIYFVMEVLLDGEE
jgi:hypothetical protein